jgi:hypothetical protein
MEALASSMSDSLGNIDYFGGHIVWIEVLDCLDRCLFEVLVAYFQLYFCLVSLENLFDFILFFTGNNFAVDGKNGVS